LQATSFQVWTRPTSPTPKTSALFRSVLDRTSRLTENALSPVDVYRMIQRRVLEAGLDANVCRHTFRAAGITAYLDNGGTLGNAQFMTAHESLRTTKLYDRTEDEITLNEVERIQFRARPKSS
jgi:integrase/recombinase XerD